MGPRSDNRGYGLAGPARITAGAIASMGPRLVTRGYVQGRAEVMLKGLKLQWVRGRITAVMLDDDDELNEDDEASMGPRSDNRGYVQVLSPLENCGYKLQWVRGRITAVMM